MSTDLQIAPDGDVAIEITSAAVIDGYDLRLTIATPELLEFQEELVYGAATFNIPPSFDGRRYRLEVVDPEEGAHFVADGTVVVSPVPGVQSYVWEPDGDSSSVTLQYVHEQDTPLATWEVTHDLGRQPSGITVVDSAGTKVQGAVHLTGLNDLEIHFSAPFSGRAIIGG